MTTSGRLRIGWIGTGVMGLPMCGHLLDAGHELHVSSRTRDRAAPLLERGARWHGEPAAVAAESDCVCTMVGFPADVREVILGEAGVLAGARPGTLLVDFTTSEPSLAVEIHEAAAERGVDALDAPVSAATSGPQRLPGHHDRRQPGGLRAGRAGPRRPRAQRRARGRPGRRPAHQDDEPDRHRRRHDRPLRGARVRRAQRPDVEQAVDTIAGGAAASWSLSNYAPRALRGDFAPGFRIEHFVKDLRIALAESRRMDLSMPGLALAEELYARAEEHGLGGRGTHALVLALAEMSGGAVGAGGAGGGAGRERLSRPAGGRSPSSSDFEGAQSTTSTVCFQRSVAVMTMSFACPACMPRSALRRLADEVGHVDDGHPHARRRHRDTILSRVMSMEQPLDERDAAARRGLRGARGHGRALHRPL
jgi:3-hydroxyisobutyrate dehydrogenase